MSRQDGGLYPLATDLAIARSARLAVAVVQRTQFGRAARRCACSRPGRPARRSAGARACPRAGRSRRQQNRRPRRGRSGSRCRSRAASSAASAHCAGAAAPAACRPSRTKLAHRVPGGVDRVGLGRHGQVDHGLRQRQFALGRCPGARRPRRRPAPGAGARGSARPMSSLAMRISAARHVARVDAAVEHARQPVQRGVGVGAAHRLVQRRDGVVELLAALVVAAQRSPSVRSSSRFVDTAAPPPAMATRFS